MKTLIVLSFILFAVNSKAQDVINSEPVVKTIQLEKRQVAIESQIPLEKRMISKSNVIALRPNYGDYKVEKYYILKTTVPPKQELDLILGSLVKIQDNMVSGEEIDPRSFSFTTTESMSRSDFIFTVFGREIRAQEPDIPEQITVCKTNNESCYGIIQIDSRTVAFPYKGVLLMLKKI